MRVSVGDGFRFGVGFSIAQILIGLVMLAFYVLFFALVLL